MLPIPGLPMGGAPCPMGAGAAGMPDGPLGPGR